MLEVVGIVFKEGGKVYYFSPGKFKLKKGTNVIVKTERGLQFGTVSLENFEISSKKINSALNKVIRIGTRKDFLTNQENIKKSKRALVECKKMVEKLGLNMMILDASYTFDREQLLFTFLADNRVDFRTLAKDLASKYKTRIELKQIGVRDKARQVGGLGSCGRPLCCSKFLTDFESVSMNMAKNQNLALNPQKVNGACGRLMCCLKYENECYKECLKKLPKVGKKITTEYGDGKVISVDILKQTYKVDVKDHGIVEVKENEGN